MATKNGSREDKSNSSQQFSTFLDDLLRSAEGLEQGRKNESFSSIELDQISNFFTRIAPQTEKSIDGCLLLAQQGIDSTQTDKLINKLNNPENEDGVKKKEETKINLHPTHRLTTATEKCEKIKFYMIEEQWKNTKTSKSKGSNNKNSDVSNAGKQKFFDVNLFNTAESIFPKDPTILSHCARDAISFANAMRVAMFQDQDKEKFNIFSPFIKIMTEWAKHNIGDDFEESDDELAKFISAFQYIFDEKHNSKLFDFSETDIPSFLNAKDDLTSSAYSLLIHNSELYLQHCYRRLKYCSIPINLNPNQLQEELDRKEKIMSFVNAEDLSIEENQSEDNKKFLSEVLRVSLDSDLWEKVWDLIRSGLSNLIPKDVVDKRQQNDIEKLRSALKNKQSDSSMLSVNISNITDLFMNQCFKYALSDQDMNTIYASDDLDVVFCHIVNLSKKLSDKRAFIQKLQSSQNEIANDYDYASSFEATTFKLLLFDFENCVNDLIRICMEKPKGEYFEGLPVLVANICLVFYYVGFYTKPYLSKIIHDLVSFLPKSSMSDVALGYLALSRSISNSEEIIQYLLGLDINSQIDISKYQFNSPKCTNIFVLVRRLYIDESENINTIRILTVCGGYVEATKCFVKVFNYLAVLSLTEISTLLEIAPVLIQNVQNDIPERGTLNKASISIALAALAKSDLYNVTERIEMVGRAEKLMGILLKTPESIEAQSVIPMINISKIITCFETGNLEGAMDIAYQTQALPFNTSFVDALQFLRSPVLQESSAVGAAVAHIVMHLSIVSTYNDDMLDDLKTMLKFSNFLDLSEDVRSCLIQVRERVGIF